MCPSDAHLVTETVEHVLAQQMGKFCPPLRSIEEPLPFGQLCMLALLRKDRELAAKLKPLLVFTTLWCQETHASDAMQKDAIELFRRSLGFEKQRDVHDSYCKTLEQDLPRFEGEEIPSSWYSLLSCNGITSALVCRGKNVPMGAMAARDELIVPAFGPQGYPLNDPSKMGIDFSCHPNWALVSADKEVWMEMQGTKYRFIGLKANTPIAFVYYVRACTAHIGTETFATQSLRRYQGPSQKVLFEGTKGRFFLESKSCKMELIPLFGCGGFWDADFLLSFEISPHDPQIAVHLGIQ